MNSIYLPIPHKTWVIIELLSWILLAEFTYWVLVQSYREILLDTLEVWRAVKFCLTKPGFFKVRVASTSEYDLVGVAIIWNWLFETGFTDIGIV